MSLLGSPFPSTLTNMASPMGARPMVPTRNDENVGSAGESAAKCSSGRLAIPQTQERSMP